MNILLALRTGFALIWTAILAVSLVIQEKREQDREIQPEKPRYTPFFAVNILPILLAIYVPIQWYQHGFQTMAENMLAVCFTILIQLTLYTAVLMAVLPLLRR